MKLSVKSRVVIWYTVWMVAIMMIVIGSVISASGFITERNAERHLMKMVHEAADEIEYDDGEVEIDDDIHFRGNGCFVAICSDDGGFFAGRLPEDVPELPFRDGVLRNDSGWYVYDELKVLPGDDLWVRGVSRSYDAMAFLSSANLLMLIILPLAAAVSAIGGYMIVRHSFRPLDRMICTAEDIACDSDLSRRIGTDGGATEIDKAAMAFDMMMDRIEESFEKEKRFTSDASHELRTPVSVILAECGYASSHTGDKASMDEAVSVISEQARKMSALISGLLYLARADRDSLKMEKEPVDAAELAGMVAETMAMEADAKGISITAECPESMIIPADRDMLMRIMINLVSNAISYGRTGGSIRIRLRTDRDYGVVEVADDGIGIAEEHLGRIWDRFYQADSSRSSSSSGLGLSLVREMVRLHGGRAEVESQEGKGSVFRIFLPLS